MTIKIRSLLQIYRSYEMEDSREEAVVLGMTMDKDDDILCKQALIAGQNTCNGEECIRCFKT